MAGAHERPAIAPGEPGHPRPVLAGLDLQAGHGLGGLDFGFVTPETSVYCSGSTTIYGAVRHCWFAPGHGSMNLANAIQNSCNIYFYTLGRRMGIDMIALAAGRLGLGKRPASTSPARKRGSCRARTGR